MFTTILFYLFALFLTISGLKVITSRNPVSSALFLVLAFFNAAAIWMLLEAEFLAILLVLVYVGAVMVLFLFVVMMLDIKLDVLNRHYKSFIPMAVVIGAIVIVEMAMILWFVYGGYLKPAAMSTATMVNGAPESNTHMIGRLIYTDYIFAFEVAGLVLLVAIIAAISLTVRTPKDAKRQDVSRQVRVRREERVRLVKMAAEKDSPAPQPSVVAGDAASAAPPALATPATHQKA